MTRSLLAVVLASTSPLLVAAAPNPSAVPLPTGTFTLAVVARIAPPPSSLTLAPTPDVSLSAPRRIESSTPELAPGLFRPKRDAYGGDGYINGSTVQEQQQRKKGAGAGIKLIMPLE